MKKKLYIILFFLVFINVSIVNVNAYSCVYDIEYEKGILGVDESAEVEFYIDPSNKTVSTSKNIFETQVVLLDYYVNSKYTDAYIVNSLNGGCPPKVVIGPIAANTILAYGIFFEESNLMLLERKEILGTTSYYLPTDIAKDLTFYGTILEEQVEDCLLNEEKSSGPLVQPDFSCDYYDKIFPRLKELKCRQSGVSCNLSDIEEYNQKRQSLKSFCSTVTKYANVNVNSCLTPCLTLGKELAKYENNAVPPKCGFSGKLILFISNIVKWIKYIIPVIVIVLGILDFIQVVSSEKDDEMKKAQGRFVKRLIAAALIFLIPFIIEFVLNKMGFEANGCGIIDL